jgi:hypothetical protein
VALNYSSTILIPRPSGGYSTTKDLKAISQYLDVKDGVPLIFTDIVNSQRPRVAGVGHPKGMVLGNNAISETGPHEVGHVADAKYPKNKSDPAHNPSSSYLMHYTNNSGNVDCEYCTKVEALAK